MQMRVSLQNLGKYIREDTLEGLRSELVVGCAGEIAPKKL